MSVSEGATESFGPNAWLVDEMYERYLADPGSVAASWRDFFADYRRDGVATAAATATPAPIPAPMPHARACALRPVVPKLTPLLCI